MEKQVKHFLKVLLIVFLIIVLFALIDYFIHSLSQEYSVPSYYFRNKIIFGTIIGLISLYFIKTKNIYIKSLMFSGIISILLQIRYFIEGYSLKFVLEFLLFHFLILFVVSLIAFKIKQTSRFK
jgi:hypothetical protein